MSDDPAPEHQQILFTPDGRYLIVGGRLWRTANPALDLKETAELIHRLMHWRRAVAKPLRAQDALALRKARDHVDATKRSLGERVPVWWHDGAPDFNRYMVARPPCATWYAGQGATSGIEHLPVESAGNE